MNYILLTTLMNNENLKLNNLKLRVFKKKRLVSGEIQ